MLFILNKTNSIANRFLAELRDVHMQQDRRRFKHNLERLGELMAYEISKELDYEALEVTTPLGTALVHVPAAHPVIGTILRAGLPFQQGLLHFFDHSAAAFVTAYRQVKDDGDFVIQIDHIATPSLDDQTLILCDTMLATGQSIVDVCKELLDRYAIRALHIAAVVASKEGIAYVQAHLPEARLWVCAVDEAMTSNAYIVPGLGDAGDLAYGEKGH